MNTDDPGISLTPMGRRVLLAVTIIGFVLLLAWALTEHLPLRSVLIVVLAGSAIAALLWQWWREWTGRD